MKTIKEQKIIEMNKNVRIQINGTNVGIIDIITNSQKNTKELYPINENVYRKIY